MNKSNKELRQMYLLKDSKRDYNKDIEVLNKKASNHVKNFKGLNTNGDTVKNNINFIRHVISTYEPNLMWRQDGSVVIMWRFDDVEIRLEQHDEAQAYTGTIYQVDQLLEGKVGDYPILPSIIKIPSWIKG